MDRECLEELAEKAALEHSLDPQLVKAVIEQESGWNPYASRYEHGFYNRYVDKLTTWEEARQFVGKAPFMISLNTELRERAFSWGLMQVMGQTAREHGYLEELTKMSEPETALDVGCEVLKSKLQRANGDLRQGLLYWNGGGNKSYPDEVFERMGKYPPNVTHGA